MDGGHQFVCLHAGRLDVVGDVVVAELLQRLVGAETIGDHRRAVVDDLLHEAAECVLAEVLDLPEANGPDPCPRFSMTMITFAFVRDSRPRTPASLPPTNDSSTSTFLRACPRSAPSLGATCAASPTLSLVRPETERTLQAQRAHTAGFLGHIPDLLQPLRERKACLVEHRPGCGRGLTPTRATEEQPIAAQPEADERMDAPQGVNHDPRRFCLQIPTSPGR